MVKGFYSDLAKAKKGEDIVRQVLQGCQDKYSITDVSEIKEMWHRGDIEIHDVEENISYYLDVKDDSRIAQTGNLLAEHRVYYVKDNKWTEGFMQRATYDYVGYLSQQNKIIYILDFKLWQKYYLSKSEKHIHIPHGYQTTDGYLMSLDKARKLGIVIAEIKYDTEDDVTFYPIEVIKRWIFI